MCQHLVLLHGLVLGLLVPDTCSTDYLDRYPVTSLTCYISALDTYVSVCAWNGSLLNRNVAVAVVVAVDYLACIRYLLHACLSSPALNSRGSVCVLCAVSPSWKCLL